MGYNISGTLSEPARILILKESDWSVETNTVVSGIGEYSIDTADNAKRLVVSRSVNDGHGLAYGSVTPGGFPDPVEYEFQTAVTTDVGNYEYFRDHSSGNECYIFNTARAGMGHVSSINYSATKCGLLFSGPTETRVSSFVRFPNVTIDQGSLITEATTSLYNFGNSSSGSFTYTIQAEDVDSGSAPTNTGEILSLTLTTAGADFPQGPQTTSTWFTSSDISNVIQEIIDRPGWVSGNDITLYFHIPVGDAPQRWFGNYSNGSSLMPKLNVTVA